MSPRAGSSELELSSPDDNARIETAYTHIRGEEFLYRFRDGSTAVLARRVARPHHRADDPRQYQRRRSAHLPPAPSFSLIGVLTGFALQTPRGCETKGKTPASGRDLLSRHKLAWSHRLPRIFAAVTYAIVYVLICFAPVLLLYRQTIFLEV